MAKNFSDGAINCFRVAFLKMEYKRISMLELIADELTASLIKERKGQIKQELICLESKTE